MTRPQKTVEELHRFYTRGPGFQAALQWARAALERGESLADVVEGSGLAVKTLRARLGGLVDGAARRRAS